MGEYRIKVGAAPMRVVVSGAQGPAGVSGSSTFAGLTDKVTAPIATTNTSIADALALLAPKASPTFTGTVTIPSGASISGYLTSATAATTYAKQIRTGITTAADIAITSASSGGYYIASDFITLTLPDAVGLEGVRFWVYAGTGELTISGFLSRREDESFVSIILPSDGLCEIENIAGQWILTRGIAIPATHVHSGADITSGDIATARIKTALTTPGPIGGTTASTGAFTTVTASGAVGSTSTTTGTIVVTGGIGASGTIFGQTIRANGAIICGGGQYIGVSQTNTLLKSPSSGVLHLHNATESDFNRIQLGGTTSSFPALKRNGTAINIRLADDSADAPLTCSNLAASGTVTAAGEITCGTAQVSAAGGSLRFGLGTSSGRGRLSATGDGIMSMQNALQTGFDRLQLGGSTSSFPALKRNGTAINIRLADDSADAPLTCSNLTASGTVTAPIIQAATGKLQINTNASGTSGSGSVRFGGSTINTLESWGGTASGALYIYSEGNLRALIGGSSGINLYQSVYPDNTGKTLGLSTHRWGTLFGTSVDITGTIKAGTYTVGTTPAHVTGAEILISSASGATVGAAVTTGGGAMLVKAASDGSAWICTAIIIP